MSLPSKKAFFNKLVFEVCGEVYEPAEDSYLFAENLQVKMGAQVLDMGTGSGILALTAAAQGTEVTAVDINPYAVRCAKQNAKINSLSDSIQFLQGDLFASLAHSAKFNLITFNAPYLPLEHREENSWLELAWVGGKTGRFVIDRFMAQAPQHLVTDGVILLMQSNLADVNQTIQKAEAEGLQVRVAAKMPLSFFETIVLLKAQFA
jgi:release factor glutamine methyltransferase